MQLLTSKTCWSPLTLVNVNNFAWVNRPAKLKNLDSNYWGCVSPCSLTSCHVELAEASRTPKMAAATSKHWQHWQTTWFTTDDNAKKTHLCLGMDVVEILTLSFLLTLTVHVHSGISHLGRFPNARSGFAGVEMNKRKLSHRPYQKISRWGFFRMIYLLVFPCCRDDHTPGPHRQIKFPLVCATSLCSRVLGVNFVFHACISCSESLLRNYFLTYNPIRLPSPAQLQPVLSFFSLRQSLDPTILSTRFTVTGIG